MARAKDEDKRTLILNTAKSLFAQKGFFNASISDIVKLTNLPVGSIYTYFKNKEEIVRIIVEEGWEDLRSRMQIDFESSKNPNEKLQTIIDSFFPELFQDVDFITILLAEAVEYTKIEEKLEELTSMIFSLIQTLVKRGDVALSFSKKSMETALMVYFLGVLHAVKLARSTNINITVPDIIDFVKQSMDKSLISTDGKKKT